MTWLIESLMGNNVGLSLAGAHFLCYSIPAWLLVLFRAVTGRFARREWLALGIFLLLLVCEIVQLMVDGAYFRRETWGIVRYFGVFAPLLWLWAAKAAAELWNGATRPAIRWLLRGMVAVSLLWVLFSANISFFRECYTNGARADVRVASSRVSRFIRRDYAGPARQTQAKRVMGEYFTTRRPVVFSNFGAVAWNLRGQAEGAIEGRTPSICPYPDDYIFIRVGSGYGDVETVDAAKYDFVGSVRGIGTEWRLFRRKTTPHRYERLTAE